MEKWKLTVEFEPLEIQEINDPENTFPFDYVSRFIAYISEYWYWDIDELTEIVKWTSTKVEVDSELIDHVAEPIQWLLMNTIPLRIELKQNGQDM